jgi:hypothetical protein
MDRFGILAILEAKPGTEQEVAEFLKSARPLVLQEVGTSTWFAFQTGPTSFGIFDTFADENGRNAHLTGAVANDFSQEQRNSSQGNHRSVWPISSQRNSAHPLDCGCSRTGTQEASRSFTARLKRMRKMTVAACEEKARAEAPRFRPKQTNSFSKSVGRALKPDFEVLSRSTSLRVRMTSRIKTEAGSHSGMTTRKQAQQ